ncbi:MAG: hypothetical protein ACRDM9_13880, partial [Gaiellaceae bacterium]
DFDDGLRERVRAAALAGRIVYTDDRCAFHTLALPALRETARPGGTEGIGCAFSLSPGGLRASTPGAAWSPDGRRVARCRGETVDVAVGSDRARPVEQYDGCTPAWRPDGTLTVVRAGYVLQVNGCPASVRPCERVLLSRDDVYDAAIRHPNVPGNLNLLAGIEVVDVAWLSGTRAAVLLVVTFVPPFRELGPLQLLAVFEAGRLLAARSRFGDDAVGLVASPSGTALAVRPRELVRRNGSQLTLPPPLQRGVSAVAFSPDGRWLAVALRGEVVLLRMAELDRYDNGGPTPRLLELPITARDLAWRSSRQP